MSLNNLKVLKNQLLNLNENRVDYVINKLLTNKNSYWYNLKPDNYYFKYLQKIDPTESKEFFDWITKVVNKKFSALLKKRNNDINNTRSEFDEYLTKMSFEDNEKYKHILELFIQNKPAIKKESKSIDINSYTDFDELFEIVKKYDNKEDILLNRKYITDKEATIIFEDDEILLVRINSFEASKFYACEANWCTKYPGQYENYTSYGNLYVLIYKDKVEKYQLHFQSGQFMNIKDSLIDMNDLEKSHPKLKALFASIVKYETQYTIENLYKYLDNNILSKRLTRSMIPFYQVNSGNSVYETEELKEAYFKTIEHMFKRPVLDFNLTLMTDKYASKPKVKLKINGTKIINGTLDLEYCELFESLGTIEKVNGICNLTDSSIKEIPNLKFTYKLLLDNTEVKSLPEDLYVKETIVRNDFLTNEDIEEALTDKSTKESDGDIENKKHELSINKRLMFKKRKVRKVN